MTFSASYCRFCVLICLLTTLVNRFTLLYIFLLCRCCNFFIRNSLYSLTYWHAVTVIHRSFECTQKQITCYFIWYLCWRTEYGTVTIWCFVFFFLAIWSCPDTSTSQLLPFCYTPEWTRQCILEWCKVCVVFEVKLRNNFVWPETNRNTAQSIVKRSAPNSN